MTNQYRYRVTLQNDVDDCHRKRFVAFSHPDFLDFWEAGEEARKHMTSQTCECDENHEPEHYSIIELERGEYFGASNGYHFREVYPSYKEDYQNQLELDI